MDLRFEVKTLGCSDLDSLTPKDLGEFLKFEGGKGKSLITKDYINGDDFVKAYVNTRKKNSSETKNVAALKSHCEAERRRRERINAHLNSLRNFVPSTDKMDKATLLAEVISQVKELKKQASEATKGLVVPTDADEVVVEPYNDQDVPLDTLTFKASICSEYKPELIPDLRQAIDRLKLNISKAEISTLGSRMKTVFIVSGSKENIGYERKDKFCKCIRKALLSVLEKISALEEYSPRSILPNKRRRDSF